LRIFNGTYHIIAVIKVMTIDWQSNVIDNSDYEINWIAVDKHAGVYFCRLTTRD